MSSYAPLARAPAKSSGSLSPGSCWRRMPERVENDIESWAGKILKGDPRAISRAITSVENREEGARVLLRRLFPHTGRATVIGITGAGGSGKSTLVNCMTAALRKRGKTVGVLAVDPTSP